MTGCRREIQQNGTHGIPREKLFLITNYGLLEDGAVPMKPPRDVWSSEDGIHWTQVSTGTPWHERIWFSSVVYRDRIWVIGGWSNDRYKNWADVWYTKDGKEWEEFKSNVSWKERHELSAFVFRDKIWVAGGMTPPLVNDVWSLKIPKDWFDNDK